MAEELKANEMSNKDWEIALANWLKSYTWIQEDGSVDVRKPRVRPHGLPIDYRELSCPEGCLEVEEDD